MSIEDCKLDNKEDNKKNYLFFKMESIATHSQICIDFCKF